MAACRGFSVRENPRFWQAVFRAFCVTPRSNEASKGYLPRLRWSRWSGYDVTPQFTLFRNVVFPPVRLCVVGGGDTIDRIVGLFCGVDVDVGLLGNIPGELDAMIATLTPLASRERLVTSQTVEMTLCFELRSTSPARINALVQRTRDQRQHHCEGIAPLIPEFVVSLLFPAVQWDWETLSELQLPLEFYSLAIIDDWHGRDLDGIVEHVGLFRESLRWALQLPPQESCATPSAGTGVRHFEFVKAFDFEDIPALCSALPHTRSLESLTVTTAFLWKQDLKVEDLMWLGLDGLKYNHSEQTRSVLAMMARGNNIMSNVDDPSDYVDGYYTATIRPGATLTLLGTDPGDIVSQQLQHWTKLDVCGVDSTDLDDLIDMMLVVVPLCGMAFIDKQDIVAIEVRPPGRPQLTALSIQGCELLRDDIAAILEHSADTLRHVSLSTHRDLVRWRPSADVVVATLSVSAHYRRHDESKAWARFNRDIVALIASFLDQEFASMA
ncbi:hypothetical protein ATCC90586_008994 [Pythium insidiosum]|nr:hypothetical protein ATCC90586_008994 [Pythium insidiosum]